MLHNPDPPQRKPLTVGDDVTHLPSGKRGEILAIRGGAATLWLRPEETVATFPISQLGFTATVTDEDVPGGENGGYAGTAATAAKLATPEGLLKLARRTIKQSQCRYVATFASGSPLQKSESGGSLPLGQRVRNRWTGVTGVVISAGPQKVAMRTANGGITIEPLEAPSAVAPTQK